MFTFFTLNHIFDTCNLCPSSLSSSAYLHVVLYIADAFDAVSWPGTQESLPWQKVLTHEMTHSQPKAFISNLVLLISDYQGCEDVFQRVWLTVSLVTTVLQVIVIHEDGVFHWLNVFKCFLLFVGCSAGSQDGWATRGPHVEQDDPGLRAVSLQSDKTISPHYCSITYKMYEIN